MFGDRALTQINHFEPIAAACSCREINLGGVRCRSKPARSLAQRPAPLRAPGWQGGQKKESERALTKIKEPTRPPRLRRIVRRVTAARPFTTATWRKVRA